MSLDILPQSLFGNNKLKIMLKNANSAIIYKRLDNDLLDKEVFVTTPLVLYVLKGVQRIDNSDGAALTVGEGEMIYFPKDIYMVSDFVAANDGFEAVLFFLSDDAIHNLSASIKERSKSSDEESSQPLLMTADCQIVDFMDSLRLVYKHEHRSKELLDVKLLELLYLISFSDNERFLSAIVNSKRLPRKRNLHQFMEQYYRTNLKMEDYAILTGRSLSSFMRDFKKTFGVTPTQWIIDRRLTQAKEMFSTEDASVTDVATAVGYESASHFISAYKKRYGITPKKDMQGA